MVSSTPPSPSQNVSQENHCKPSPNAESSPHVCTEIFKKSVEPTSPESKTKPSDKAMIIISEKTVAQREEEKAMEVREHFVQMIMQDKGVSRKVAEAEYDFFS